MNKPFTELPAPKRMHRLSIVAVWNPITGIHCENPKCFWPDAEEVCECPVCGRNLCEVCYGENGAGIALPRIDYAGVYSCPCCSDCGKLTNDERQAVMDLRTQLGGAM